MYNNIIIKKTKSENEMRKVVDIKLKDGELLPVIVEQDASNTVHLKMHMEIFNDKGVLSNHHQFSVKGQIDNLIGVLLSYLGRTMGDNPKEHNQNLLELIIDNESFDLHSVASKYNAVVKQYYLNGIPVSENDTITLSIKRNGRNDTILSAIELPIKDIESHHSQLVSGFILEHVMIPQEKRNGIPGYCRSELINKIFFYSGFNALDEEESKKIRKEINEHRSLLHATAKVMYDSNIHQITRNAFLRILGNVGKVKSVNEAYAKKELILNIIERNSTTQSVEISQNYTFANSRKLTLKPEWFEG